MRLHPEDIRAIAAEVAALLGSAPAARPAVFEERDLSSQARQAVLAKKLKAEQKGRQSV